MIISWDVWTKQIILIKENARIGRSTLRALLKYSILIEMSLCPSFVTKHQFEWDCLVFARTLWRMVCWQFRYVLSVGMN